MVKLKGYDIVISISGTPIALCRYCDFEIDREMKETSSLSNGDAKEFIPGRYSWKMSSAHLVGNLNEQTLMGYLLQKTKLSISIGTVSGVGVDSSFSFSGQAYMKSFKMAAPVHGFASANCTFVGTGTIA